MSEKHGSGAAPEIFEFDALTCGMAHTAEFLGFKRSIPKEWIARLESLGLLQKEKQDRYSMTSKGLHIAEDYRKGKHFPENPNVPPGATMHGDGNDLARPRKPACTITRRARP